MGDVVVQFEEMVLKVKCVGNEVVEYFFFLLKIKDVYINFFVMLMKIKLGSVVRVILYSFKNF